MDLYLDGDTWNPNQRASSGALCPAPVLLFDVLAKQEEFLPSSHPGLENCTFHTRGTVLLHLGARTCVLHTLLYSVVVTHWIFSRALTYIAQHSDPI